MTNEVAPTIGCDTQDMRLVHRVFRAVFADGPWLVEDVAIGDDRRRRHVAAHLKELALALHHHHETEDELLWDTLTRRAPGCALHVQLMKTQHASMAEILAEADEALPAWTTSGTEADRERVHAAMVGIDQLLGIHLGDEETLILPAAGETMNQREWDKLGEFARRTTRPAMLFPQLGFMLQSLPPGEGDRFMRETLPTPVRVLWQVVGKGQYRRYRGRIYGTRARRRRRMRLADPAAAEARTSAYRQSDSTSSMRLPSGSAT